MFRYIEEVLDHLDNLKIELEIANREIEMFFEEMLMDTNEGYLNINSRV